MINQLAPNTGLDTRPDTSENPQAGPKECGLVREVPSGLAVTVASANVKNPMPEHEARSSPATREAGFERIAAESALVINREVWYPVVEQKESTRSVLMSENCMSRDGVNGSTDLPSVDPLHPVRVISEIEEQKSPTSVHVAGMTLPHSLLPSGSLHRRRN